MENLVHHFCVVAPCEELPNIFRSFFSADQQTKMEGEKRRQKADQLRTKISLNSFFFFHFLPLLVCEAFQLVFVPDTCMSVCFSTVDIEKGEEERERQAVLDERCCNSFCATISKCIFTEATGEKF